MNCLHDLYPTISDYILQSPTHDLFVAKSEEKVPFQYVAICLYGVKPAPSFFKPWDSPGPNKAAHPGLVQAAMLLPPMQHFLQHFQGSFHIQLPRNQEPAQQGGNLTNFYPTWL
jgi:hypothetical protein